MRRSLRALSIAAVVVSVLPADAATPGTTVIQPPRIQLGDAPLVGFPGAEADRITVVWQTGDGSPGETWEVGVRRPGQDRWVAADSIRAEEYGGRVFHEADIEGLDWSAIYEYRVARFLGGDEVESWVHAFMTRLRPGDGRPFRFAAHGDSAWWEAPEGFDAVQAGVAESKAGFTILLGDNAYEHGSVEQYDARFDPTLVPASAELLAGHVEYVAYGNHDMQTDAAGPTEMAFAAPVPVAGVTSPLAPPDGEPPEHNYSFDHGRAHFVTFDSTSIFDPARLDALLDWVTADLAASEATWKIVFAHHPIAAPDKADELAALPHYLSLVVSRLSESGADLFMAGHSHTYSWSYPLSGLDGGEPRYVPDQDGMFRQGDGFVQVVSGVGGHSVRDVRYDQPFIADSYTVATEPPGEFGFTLVHVSALELRVEYVAADDGAVLGGFSIVIPTPAFGAGRYAR